MTDAPLPETLVTSNGHEPETEITEADRQALAALELSRTVGDLRAKGFKVELSGGQWAILADPDLITERKVHPIKVAMLKSVKITEEGHREINPEGTIDGGLVVVAAFLRSWSFEFPLPTPDTPSSLLELPARDFSTLSSAASDLRAYLFDELGPVPEPAPN